MMYLIDKKEFGEKVNFKYLGEVCEGKVDDLNGIHNRVILLQSLTKAPHILKTELAYVKNKGIILELIYHNKREYISLGDEMDWWKSGSFFVQVDLRKKWYRIFRCSEELAVSIGKRNETEENIAKMIY